MTPSDARLLSTMRDFRAWLFGTTRSPRFDAWPEVSIALGMGVVEELDRTYAGWWRTAR